MNTKLLVHKGLEQQGKIGALYVHEVAVLGGGCVGVFLLVLALRATCKVSLLWFLTAPSLLGIAFFLAKSWRQEAHPSLMVSWFSFHFQQPKQIGIAPSQRHLIQEN